MKFLVPNYSCFQNPRIGGYRPQIPILSVLNWICWTPPRTKFLGTPLPEDGRNYRPKHVELIEIVNKTIIVASSWMFILLRLQIVVYYWNCAKTKAKKSLLKYAITYTSKGIHYEKTLTRNRKIKTDALYLFSSMRHRHSQCWNICM